jgi:hypothetical protein
VIVSEQEPLQELRVGQTAGTRRRQSADVPQDGVQLSVGHGFSPQGSGFFPL